MKATITKEFIGALEIGQLEQAHKAGDIVEINSEERLKELEAAGLASRGEDVSRPSARASREEEVTRPSTRSTTKER